MPSPAFLKKLDGLDEAGLRSLVIDLTVDEERARSRFAKSRSIRDGQTYDRRKSELGEARARLRRLS